MATQSSQLATRSFRCTIGLTLIELLAAVAILATGAVFVMGAMARAAEAQALSDEYRQAYLFALTKMATAEMDFSTGAEMNDEQDGSFLVGSQPFAWRLSAQPETPAGAAKDEPASQPAASPQEGATIVTLTVTWRRGEQEYAQAYRTTLWRANDDASSKQ